MKRSRPFILAFCLLTAASPLHATSLFEDTEPLEIELAGPLSSLVKNKEKKEDQPFRMRVDGKELGLEVRSRGNSRIRVCSFPPLRLNFSAADTGGTVFEGLGKLKLVTACRGSDSSRQDVLEEYAAYRIFNLLTAASFRVRLVHLSSIDTDKDPGKTETDRYGFLIEPAEQLSRRMDGTQSDLPAVSLKSMNPQQAALVYVFQYLIGNTDWSFVKPEYGDRCCHNIRLIAVDSMQTPVPYDFDLAGLVNASYAAPDPSLHIKKVRQRVYRGFCTETDILREAISLISSRRQAILAVISDLPLLTEKEKSRQRAYLEAFFEKASDGDSLIRSFEKTCHP